MSQEEAIPVFNESNEFTVITEALNQYGKAVSRGVFTRLKFTQSPSLPPDFDPASPIVWRVEVHMACFDHPEDSTSTYDNTWEAQGADLFAAMVELSKTIREDLEGKVAATTEALKTLAMDDSQNVWSTESDFDNNQEDIPEDS